MSFLNNQFLFDSIGEWVLLSFLLGFFMFPFLYILIRRTRANAKTNYLIAVYAMLLFFIINVLTFSYLFTDKSSAIESTTKLDAKIEIQETANLSLNTPVPSASEPSVWNLLKSAYPYLGILWMLGVLFMCFRSAFQLYSLQNLRKTAIGSVPQQYLDRIAHWSKKLNISKSVAVKFHAAIDSPFTFGFWKPIILLPVGFFNGLSSEQAEAILIHELQHIREHDFLINQLFNLLQIIFFYHPLVWWLNKVIEDSRENYRDDQTISLSGNKMALAKALTQVEILKHEKINYALYFSHNQSKLKTRIMRLFSEPKQHKSSWKSILGLGLLILLITTFSIAQQLNHDEIVLSENDTPSKITKIDMPVENGSIQLEFSLHHLLPLEIPEKGQVSLDDQMMKSGQRKILDDTELYFYINNKMAQSIAFYSKKYAEENSISPQQLQGANKSVTVITPTSESYALELLEWSAPKNTKQDGKQKLRIIGYENFNLAKNENGNFYIDLINPQQIPLVKMDGKEISWDNFSTFQKNNDKSFDYSIYDDKDGILQFGEKAKYGAIIIETKIAPIIQEQDSSKNTNESSLIINSTQSNSSEPLYVVDGTVVSSVLHLKPDQIQSITVLKDEKAIRKYGESGANGVVEIYTKKPLDVIKQANKRDSIPSSGTNKPLFVIDGRLRELTDGKFPISPDNIHSVEVIKGEKALNAFGEQAKDGVIHITSKSAKEKAISQAADSSSSANKFKSLADGLEKLALLAEKLDNLTKKLQLIEKEIDLNEFAKSGFFYEKGELPVFIVNGRLIQDDESYLLKTETIDHIHIFMINTDEHEKYQVQPDRPIIMISTKN